MGWIANFVLIASLWLVGRKNRLGFVLGAIGNILWLYMGYQKSMNDLVFIALVCTILHIYNWIQWKSENKYWESLKRPEFRKKWWKPF